MTWFDACISGFIVGAFLIVIYIFWLPKPAHICAKQCLQRLMTLFTGWAEIKYKGKETRWLQSWFDRSSKEVNVVIRIPNALFVTMYLACCVISIATLP